MLSTIFSTFPPKEFQLAKQYRTIRLFSLHGHQNGDKLDYRRFFMQLEDIPKSHRTVEINDDLYLHLYTCAVNGSEVHLQVAGGHPENTPMIVDSQTGDVSPASLPEHNWIGRISQIVIRITDQGRVCAIENRRNGVTTVNLALLLIRLYEQNYGSRVELSFPPIADASFFERIHSMTRIRQVTVEMSQPNLSWDDDYETAAKHLAKLAAKSEAHKCGATFTAPRGESLSTNAGIVSVVESQLASPRTNIEKVSVKGNEEGRDRETTLTLNGLTNDKSIKKREVSIPKNATLDQIKQTVAAAARSFIDDYLKMQ